MSDDPGPRLDEAPAPPATDRLAEPSPDPDPDPDPEPDPELDPEKAAPGQEVKAPPEDNDLRCTLCGLRACWSG
jgi:hypothetical protein